MSQMINTENLKLADVRLFDAKRMASEIPNVHGYSFLVKDCDTYYNVFNPLLDYPVYERVPYSNTTLDGEDYGTKIQLVQGEACDGICYIIEPLNFQSLFGNNQISLAELKAYMLSSQFFFLDRHHVLEEEPFHLNTIVRNRKIREADEKSMVEFERYLGASAKSLRLKKN